MIPLTSANTCPVAKTAPPTLVLFNPSEEWLPCLSVKRGADVTLLALNFKDPAGGPRWPFLLPDIAERNCLVLGRAEFYFTYPNPFSNGPGPLSWVQWAQRLKVRSMSPVRCRIPKGG